MKFFINLLLFVSLVIFSLFSNDVVAKTNYYEDAVQTYHEGDIDTAFIHLKNALRENESNLPAKLLLAEVLIKKKSFTAAEQELNDAILQGADFNLIVEPLGRALLLQGKYESILQLGDRKVLHQESEIALNLLKAKAHSGLSNVKAAEDIYKRVLLAFPENTEATLELASLNITKNNIAQSQLLLDKAEAMAINNSRFWQVKGQLARAKGFFEEALTFLRKANSLEPDNIAILRTMASNYIALEQFEKAREVIDSILVSHPQDLQAQLMKGNVLKSLDENQLADEILTKLTNQLSSIDESFMLSQPQLLLIDAMSSYRQENWLQAQKKFKLYINQETGEEDMSAVMLLSDVHMKLKQPDQALKLLSNYESYLIKNKDYALILAGLYLQFGENFKADYVLNKLMPEHKKDEEVLILSAKALSATGQEREALMLLEASNFTDSANYQHTLTVVALRLGEMEKSYKYVKSLIALSPEKIDYQLLYVRVLIQLSQFDDAEKVINDLYKKHPENNLVRFSYAFLQFNLNNYEVAKAMLKDLVNEDPEHSESWFILAQIAFDSDEVEEAISILERQTKSESEANRHKALDKLATVYFSQQQFEKSLSVINVLLQKNRLNAQALFIKSKNLIALKQIKEAKHQLNILLSLWSDDARNLLRLSKLQLRIKDIEGAERSLDMAYEIAPRALPVIIDLTKLQIKLNKLSQATSVLNKAEKSGYQDNIFLTILKGDIELAKNNTKVAFDYYIRVLKKDDTNVIALMKLAQISDTKGLSDKFKQQLTVLVNKYPERVVQRHVLADHLFTRKDYQQAKFQYQKLITQDIPSSKRAWALNNLAGIHLIEKSYASAVEVSEQAYKMMPAPAILDTYGWSLVLSNEVEQGLSYLRQAFTMSSTNPEIKYHIAYALAKLNRKAEAQVLLESIIKLSDTFAEHKLAKQLLDTL